MSSRLLNGRVPTIATPIAIFHECCRYYDQLLGIKTNGMQVHSCKFGSARGESEHCNVAPAPSQNYIRAIHAHSLRSITKSTYPGQNYVDIATWLLQNADLSPSPLLDSHWLAIFYDLSAQNIEKLRGLYCRDIKDIICPSRPSRGAGQLLFFRGFLPPAWIAAIGNQYGIDPEFIHRHLGFFADSVHRKVFSLPWLISTKTNINRLCVNTILFQDRPIRSGNWHIELHRCRQERADQVGTYRRQLKTRARGGDSLVREFSTLGGQFSIIEQWKSIAIIKNWGRLAGHVKTVLWTLLHTSILEYDIDRSLGLIWMENCRDLAASPPGSWTPGLDPHTSTFPIIWGGSHPWMAGSSIVSFYTSRR